MNTLLSQPTIEIDNFELKQALIIMVQQHQFTRHPSEDPNEHMGRFMRMVNPIKLNGVRPEVIRDTPNFRGSFFFFFFNR